VTNARAARMKYSPGRLGYDEMTRVGIAVRRERAARGWAVGLLAGFGPLACAPGPDADAGRLVVFNAGSLAAPFRDLLREFTRLHPEYETIQESAGSLETARKLTELGRIPDVVGVADYGVIPALLVPRFAGWYVGFARNAMVLAYTDRSIAAAEIDSTNWWRILLRPDVRVARADPSLDPNGYRSLMVYQLAERHYREPGLAAHLLAASPRRFVRAKEADLVALLQAGEVDYAWSYRSMALTLGFRHLSLPASIDLSDPDLADRYREAAVRVPGATHDADSVEFHGEPIVYGLTIPRGAAHQDAAHRFVRFVLSGAGRAILDRHGFTLPARPGIGGPEAPPADIFPDSLPDPSPQR